MNYTRKQNTNWQQVNFEKLITEGEAIVTYDGLKNFQSTPSLMQDALQHKQNAQDWIQKGNLEINDTYESRALIDAYYCTLPDIDPNNYSASDIIRVVNKIISERIEKLKELSTKTSWA